MITLFLDTHLNDIIVFLLENGKVVDKKEVINQKNNSEVLLPSIIDVIDGKKLDEIIIVNGPGSFTGVRLGVTIAKTLAYTLDIPIKTITSLQVMAISSESMKVAISDNNGYYLGEFNQDYTISNEYKYVDNETFINLKKEYQTDYQIDPVKVCNYLKYVKPTNAHEVNPIYIKKIGVEIDKNSK